MWPDKLLGSELATLADVEVKKERLGIDSGKERWMKKKAVFSMDPWLEVSVVAVRSR